MPLRIEIADRLTPEVREAWMSLLPRQHWGFFSHPDWCQSIWNHFGPTLRLRFVMALDGDEPVGLLPVWVRRMNKFGLFLPVAELFGSRRGDYGGPLIHPDADVPEVLGALFDAAVDLDGTRGTLVWPNLPDGHGFAEVLDARLQARGLEHRRGESICHVIELDGTYDEIAAGWNRKQRQNINRYRRKLLADFDTLDLITFDTREQALEKLPAFFAMHDRRWVEAGNPGTFDDPTMREFFTELVERLAGTHLYFSALMAGDRPVAYRIGFVHGGMFMAYKSAFEWDLRQYSPGQVMNAATIEDGVERGWTGIDLLGGDYDYKDSLSTTTKNRVTYFVRTGRVAPGYWWLTKGRPRTQRLVGGVAYKAMERWSRLKRALRRSGGDADDGGGE